ncbi:hypothetical protein EDB80DRAFT_751594 [Ilyonectria destructans]|nr:hypothetical protein EDB80DRAFT_751594 [Ilyonectria destructans]
MILQLLYIWFSYSLLAAGCITYITGIHTSCFSPISPYLTTCPPYGDSTVPNHVVYRQECDGYDSRYLNSPAHGSQPNNIFLLIRKELEAIFFEESASFLRKEPPFRLGWRRDGMMTTVNQLQLPREVFTQDHNPGDLIEYLNKEIMIYFPCAALVYGHQEDKLGRYLYREWLRLHNGRPPFQRHSFFAKPVCFGEKGPRSIQQISLFHKTLCSGISARLNDAVNFHPTKAQPPAGNTDAPPMFNPMPSKTIRSWQDHGFNLKHIFRSLFIVIDDQELAGDQEQPAFRARRPHEDLVWYLEECHDWRLSQYTALLVKTGDEASLHSPISFQPLFEAGLALDVNRHDYTGAPEEAVVRVKVDVAEQEALEDVGQAAQALVEEQRQLCDIWIENVMSHAQRVGIDENGYTWLAARRARARMNGEAFDEDQVKPSWEYLRHWEC